MSDVPPPKKKKNYGKEIAKTTLDTTRVLIGGAFSLIAALAWNAWAQDFITKRNWQKVGLLYYAIIVTFIAVVVLVLLSLIPEPVS